jgi:single-strand DNA-binding protein
MNARADLRSPLDATTGPLCTAASITFELRRGRHDEQEQKPEVTMASTKSTTAAKPREAEPQPEQTTLIGRLTADPKLRHTSSGKPVSTIRIAVNKPDAETTFHSVVVWGRTAEVVCEYLAKGRIVEVTGRPQQRSYTAADGTERTVAEVNAWRVQFGARPAAPSNSTSKEVE